MRFSTFKTDLQKNPQRTKYPAQFWVLIFGSFINSVGGTMIWPFILLFFRSQLGIGMLQASSLFTVKAAASILSSFVAGSLTDRFGRKRVMVFSLISSGLIYLLFIPKNPFLVFVFLMALSGTVEPMYRVGSNAMVADMLPADTRSGGYAILRMVTNIGLTIGPLLSGILIQKSYALMFSVSAICLVFYGLFIWVFIRETLQKTAEISPSGASTQTDFGYAHIFADKQFIIFCVSFFFTMTCMAPVFVTLTAYANENFAIPESQLSLLLTTNALMVIFFQFIITRLTDKYSPIRMMALGALLYAIGSGSIALGSSLIGFIICMAIVTLGEIILMPTSTTFTANISPAHLRGRYMSIYGLSIEAAVGLGPILAGALNDYLFPKAIWIGCMLFALISIPGYLMLGRNRNNLQKAIS